MERIKNMWSIIARFVSALVSAIKWLSDDQNTKDIHKMFDAAEKIAVSTVRLYKDNTDAIVGTAKALNTAMESVDGIKTKLAADLKDVADGMIEAQDKFKEDVDEINQKLIRKLRKGKK